LDLPKEEYGTVNAIEDEGGYLHVYHIKMSCFDTTFTYIHYRKGNIPPFIQPFPFFTTLTIKSTYTSTMKFVALFGILPLLAAAAPTQRDSVSFTAMSGDGCPEIDNKPLQAASQKFWLGGEPSTYCPTVVAPYCPPGNVTAFNGPYGLVRSVRSY
jgi:hypothetical protein